jgi:ATP-dependent DNA helicase RecG
MRGLKLREPTITELENGVLVSLRHEPLASPEETLVAYLRENPQVSNSQARELCHVNSENIMKRIFERMMESGLLERVPGKSGRAIAYQLTQAGRVQ